MRSVITIILFVIALQAIGQQGLQMDFGEVDSSEVKMQRQIEHYNFINGGVNNSFLMQNMKLPEFNFHQAYSSRYTLSLPLGSQNIMSPGFSMNGDRMITTPFYNAEMLSSEAYQLGNKFVLGGYSYGANSVFSAPLPNQNSSYFDTYGSTMFLQYKVSKKFKIETSISIQQNRQGPPGF